MIKRVLQCILLLLLIVFCVMSDFTIETYAYQLEPVVSHSRVCTVEILEAPIRGTIFIGDSRTVALDEVCNLSSKPHTWVIAKCGEGAVYLRNTVLTEIAAIRNENADVDTWTVVSMFGVNDPYNFELYADCYNELVDCDLFVAYVNPVDTAKLDAWGYDSTKISDGIEWFNNQLADSGYTLLDLRDVVEFETVDGLHYTSTTCVSISSAICSMLTSKDV